MENKAISRVLQKLEFNELEQDCYLSLLKKSPQHASNLAKELEKPKATVLLALARLSDELGVVTRFRKKNSFEFSVDDPRGLLFMLNRQASAVHENQKVVESLLPELRSLQQFTGAKPKVEYYEGKTGIKQVFAQVLEEADKVIGYGSNEDEKKYLPQIFPDYYEQRVAKKIPVRAIVPATMFNIKETIDNEQKHQRQTHLIPAECNYPIQVNIFKNSVIFFSFEENFSLVVKSKPIAQCLEKIFELAYDKAAESDEKIRKTRNN